MADLCVCEGLFLAQPLLRVKESVGRFLPILLPT
jgi:hypothetical protein